MASTKMMQEVEKVLKNFEDKYYINNKVNKARVIEDIDNYDVNLISAMLENKAIKLNFTTKIDEHILFKTNKFIELFQADEYWEDSYTKYSKKIGLNANGTFLDEASEVVLDFPYKDTVLKASMSKEDTDKEDLKPNEPFLNEVIAREEIDVLLDKKILVNTKKYTEDGEEEVTEFSEDDNLILKGNNLLALHTLKDKYAGKVKLIYIDPPYNTGNDSFLYNDKFNHSTWLTFMKNRLEIAHELLSNDGSIWVNIDDDESHYLKVLCDEIFGRENFLANVIWEKKFSLQNDATWFSDNHDHILAFAKNKETFSINQLPRTDKMNSRYKNPDNDPRGPWQSDNLTVGRITEKDIYPIKTPKGRIVYPTTGNSWRVPKENFEKLVEDNRVWFGEDGGNVPRLKRFLSEVKDGRTPTTIWKHEEVGHTQEAKRELNKIDGVEYFSTPKPERLVKQILTIGSNENDLVLDFFMGSSTTQAVAHKMNRRYIGIEQMDYISTVSVPRLQKVIEGEQGGISKDVDWQGGGSFVYAELMEKNRGYLEDVTNASDQADLGKVFNLMLENADFDFQVDLNEVKESLNTLSLEDQKRILIRIIDKNQLYYNYSEINDENVRDLISNNDYEFNRNFYKEENNE
ncbi:site-specific DNA-methyltransferase [Carnobacteriaceae bacterium 52-44]